MKKSDLVSSCFWLLFSSLAAVESYRLRLGHFHRPGPGFLPFAASLLFAGLSLLLLLQSIRGPKETHRETAVTRRRTKIFYTVGALFLYVFLLERLGFVVCTLLLIAFLLRIVEQQRWPVVVVIALFTTLFSYVLFETCLHIQLPSFQIIESFR